MPAMMQPGPKPAGSTCKNCLSRTLFKQTARYMPRRVTASMLTRPEDDSQVCTLAKPRWCTSSMLQSCRCHIVAMKSQYHTCLHVQHVASCPYNQHQECRSSGREGSERPEAAQDAKHNASRADNRPVEGILLSHAYLPKLHLHGQD